MPYYTLNRFLQFLQSDYDDKFPPYLSIFSSMNFSDILCESFF